MIRPIYINRLVGQCFFFHSLILFSFLNNSDLFFLLNVRRAKIRWSRTRKSHYKNVNNNICSFDVPFTFCYYLNIKRFCFLRFYFLLFATILHFATKWKRFVYCFNAFTSSQCIMFRLFKSINLMLDLDGNVLFQRNHYKNCLIKLWNHTASKHD